MHMGAGKTTKFFVSPCSTPLIPRQTPQALAPLVALTPTTSQPLSRPSPTTLLPRSLRPCRNPTAALPIHNIHDRSFLTDQSDPESARQWPKANGINVRGTPLGTPDFTESYLFGKGIKHRELLCCIKDVAVACFPREVVAMLAGAAGPRLTHLLKSVETKPRTETWMIEKDSAHLSTWLHCLTASSDLDMALGLVDKDLLTD